MQAEQPGGQNTLPEMSLTVVPDVLVLNWLNGREIEPSGWTT